MSLLPAGSRPQVSASLFLYFRQHQYLHDLFPQNKLVVLAGLGQSDQKHATCANCKH